MKYYFSINMTSEEFLPYYQGQIHSLIVTSTQGQRIQFPAMHIRKYLTRSGVRGYFCMETKNNKFLSLSKLR
ncbi:DUF2835 domain-containing protein [Thalassomonas actiniarum]|uniref:DUF2835 domain-containing protein n=1 Tax=Thalassomonas actiniarum TaxID=485447 RepID=A0AAE9YJQ8_9GAMM|nr:DUF2835 domain-containing protein [Thalassomonas actiniarum]WDD96990.1 DUF2835 domain-containing protein [Thalassomonas actiniarum]